MHPRIQSIVPVSFDYSWKDDVSCDSTIDMNSMNSTVSIGSTSSSCGCVDSATNEKIQHTSFGSSSSSSSTTTIGPVVISPLCSPKRSVSVTAVTAKKMVRHNVRFAPEDEIFLVRHINDFTDDEIAAIWFDQQYYSSIKSEYKEIVFTLECGKYVESDTITCRGLEHRTQRGSCERYEIKRNSYNAVLDEQDKQWQDDHDDDEMISYIYQKHSVAAANKAHQVALRDENAAQVIYTESFVQMQQVQMQLQMQWHIMYEQQQQQLHLQQQQRQNNNQCNEKKKVKRTKSCIGGASSSLHRIR